MNEETFNLSLHKFLKMVGVSSQNEIEKAVARATAEFNNWQLHQHEYDFAKKNAKHVAQSLSKHEGRVVTEQEAELIQCRGVD